ncbi:hypothetical protein C8R44DRAFT_849487 [Mycena epipterygia]|nr:hypothetical protein C8R44DRAFT_849487 [Mycena epipterygia]
MDDLKERELNPSLPAFSDSELVLKKGQTAKPHLIVNFVAVHVGHGLLVAVHIVALVAALKGWSIDIGFLDVPSVQSGVTAGLQAAFILIIGGLVSLVREIAVDADIRNPPTLGLLHLRLKAWSGLSSSLSANWLYSRSPSELDSPGLKNILLYLGFCALLQLSSGSIFAIDFDPNATSTVSNFSTAFVDSGARFGNFDVLWGDSNITSSDTIDFPPAAQATRTNDTRYPGLHGRLLHDTVNLDDTFAEYVAWSQARVDATLVNVHCSQISNATINTFTLPFGSTDMRLAQPSPRDAQDRFLFRNSSASFGDEGAWINVSIPAPPDWDPNVPPVLNITGYWGFDGARGLPTTVLFQSWAFDRAPIGSNQLVMVIAAQRTRAILIDSNNSTGNTLNLTMYQEPDSDGTHGEQAYIQVVGCTVKNDNLTATINPQSRLLDPLTDRSRLIGPEAQHDDHAWDEFEWEADADGVSPTERQFLLAFRPSSAYNNTSTDPRTTPVGSPESIMANILDGQIGTPFDLEKISAPNALVNFQGSLERLFASYLWNVNRLCSPFDPMQPYWETCGTYWSAESFFSPADFEFVLPSIDLIVVKWRAIVSLVSSLLMWLLVSGLLGITMRGTQAQQATGLLDIASVLRRESRIPEVVVAETMGLNLKPNQNPQRALLEAVLTKRLTYLQSDDGLGGYLDVED